MVRNRRGDRVPQFRGTVKSTTFWPERYAVISESARSNRM